MSNQTTMATNNTKSNFGSKGWLMIVFAGIMFYFYSGFCTDGLNIIVTNFAISHNLEVASVLAITTPAAWFGILGSIVWAVFADRTTLRLTLLVTSLLGGASFMLYGMANSITGFFIITSLVNFMGMGFTFTVANSLMAKWFPVKKGLALGWATMGQNLASATFVPLFLLILHKISLQGSFYTMGIILIIAGIAGWFVVRDTPEELGCSPDNGEFTSEEIEANLKELQNYKSPWTPTKLITNKQIWLIGLGFGIYILVTVALISQLIPRLMASNWPIEKATGMMSVAAILGLIGSYGTGWLDQKIGTKSASILYGVWYLIALILCAIPNPSNLVIYASIFFTGIGIGGVGNLFPSMATTVFGRFDFIRSMAVLNPITGVVRSFAFTILAFGIVKLGGYCGAYAIIAVLDVIGIFLVSRIDPTCIGKE